MPLFRVILLALCLIPGSAAAAAWPIADLAVLVDPAGRETIESVSRPERAQAFVPAPRGLAAGYTRDVHWLRIRLDAPPEGRLLLEIQPPYLDDLRLYLPDGRGGFRLRQTGDTHPFSSRDIPVRGFVFPVEFSGNATETLYLRVETTSTSLVLPRVWRPDDFLAAHSAENLFLGIYYGLLIALLLINLWHGHWRHDPDHRAFLLYALSVLGFSLALNGLVSQYFVPRHPEIGHHAVSIAVMLIIAAAAHFHRRVLLIDRRTPFLNAYFLGMIALAVVGVLAIAAGQFTEAARFITLAPVLLLILGLARTAALWRQGQAGSLFIAAAQASSLLSYLAAGLSVQGVLSSGLWQLYSLQGGSLAALLAFNLGLFERLRRIAHQRDTAIAAVREAQVERDAEARARERQGALLAMLTHELKTPLSVIRLRLGMRDPTLRMQANAERSVAEIDGIVARCALAARLDEDAQTARIESCDAQALLLDCIARQEGERIELACPAEAGSATVASDPALLAIVLGNLIDNALKYSPPAARVRVTLAEEAREGRAGLTIAIANPAGAAGRPDPGAIFQKYYRAPGAHARSGSGLGLHIVRVLAGMIGAHIRYRADRPDIVFELWLPRAAS